MSANFIPEEWNHAGRVSFAEIERRLHGASLPERNAILQFVCSNVNRIRPAIDNDWLYDSKSIYLLDCIALMTDSDDDDSIHSPFEAADELVEWFNWIVERDGNLVKIRKRIDRITSLFKAGCTSVQNCIETGFLEHTLETPRNRPFFSHWKDDQMLSDSYTAALRWGEAHSKPDDSK